MILFITKATMWNIAQFIVNLLALAGGAAVWKMYFDNLKADLSTKKSHIDFLTDQKTAAERKVESLEKRSPEYFEKLLEERIQVREEEIRRLKNDKASTEAETEKALKELHALTNELARTRGFRAVLDLDDPEDQLVAETTSLTGGPGEITVAILGQVGVDSGQLMITDPCYIDNEWQHEEFQDIRRYLDTQDEKIYQFQRDFENYMQTLPGHDNSISSEIKSGRLVHLPEPKPSTNTYSYNGACQATSTNGYGELVYKLGHAGAGVAFQTAWGDGQYPVYGEFIDNRLVRVYISVG